MNISEQIQVTISNHSGQNSMTGIIPVVMNSSHRKVEKLTYCCQFTLIIPDTLLSQSDQTYCSQFTFVRPHTLQSVHSKQTRHTAVSSLQSPDTLQSVHCKQTRHTAVSSLQSDQTHCSQFTPVRPQSVHSSQTRHTAVSSLQSDHTHCSQTRHTEVCSL